MHITLMGRRYRLQFCRLGREQARGICDPPSIRGKQIRIDERLKDEEQLEVILHELLHACDWRGRTSSTSLSRPRTWLAFFGGWAIGDRPVKMQVATGGCEPKDPHRGRFGVLAAEL